MFFYFYIWLNSHDSLQKNHVFFVAAEDNGFSAKVPNHCAILTKRCKLFWGSIFFLQMQFSPCPIFFEALRLNGYLILCGVNTLESNFKMMASMNVFKEQKFNVDLILCLWTKLERFCEVNFSKVPVYLREHCRSWVFSAYNTFIHFKYFCIEREVPFCITFLRFTHGDFLRVLFLVCSSVIWIDVLSFWLYR